MASSATQDANVRPFLHSTLVLENSTISGNLAYHGLRLTDHSTATLGDDTTTGNAAGGVSVESASWACFRRTV